MEEHALDSLRAAGFGQLARLPDALVSYLTFLVDMRDVGRLACTCKLLRTFCYEEPLWLHLCVKLYEGQLNYQVRCFLLYAVSICP